MLCNHLPSTSKPACWESKARVYRNIWCWNAIISIYLRDAFLMTFCVTLVLQNRSSLNFARRMLWMHAYGRLLQMPWSKLPSMIRSILMRNRSDQHTLSAWKNEPEIALKCLDLLVCNIAHQYSIALSLRDTFCYTFKRYLISKHDPCDRVWHRRNYASSSIYGQCWFSMQLYHSSDPHPPLWRVGYTDMQPFLIPLQNDRMPPDFTTSPFVHNLISLYLPSGDQ